MAEARRELAVVHSDHDAALRAIAVFRQQLSLSQESLRAGVDLVESAYAHVSHGGPTRADAEKWLKQAKLALAKERSEGV